MTWEPPAGDFAPAPSASNWSPPEEDFKDIGMGESLARGAANNVPLLPQAIAGGEALTGLGDEGGYSKNIEDWNAKAATAKEAHPITYGAGSVVGALAPLAIPGLGEVMEAAPIATGAGLGVANALSNKDLSKNPGENLKEAAIGAGLGAGTSALTGALMDRFIPKVAEMGTSPEAVAAKIANPDMEAANPKEMAEHFPDIYQKMKTAAKGTSDYADTLLSSSPYLEEGAIPKDNVIAAAKSARSSVGGRSDEAQKAVKTLEDWQDSLKSLHSTVSEQNLKAVIRDMDKDINWDKIRFQPDYKPTLEEKGLMKLRGSLDDILKSNNPEYGDQMNIVEDLLTSAKEFGKNFGLLRREGEIVPSNRTMNAISTALKPQNAESQRIMGKAEELTGEPIKNPLLLRQFNGPTPESPMGIPSRVGGTVVGAGAGSGLGLGGVGLGGLVGNRVLRKPMSELGRKMVGAALTASQNPKIAQGANQELIDYLTSKYAKENQK